MSGPQSLRDVLGPVVLQVSRVARRRDLRPEKWRTVLRRDPCVYCGGPSESLDHITPRRAGGGAAYENAAPACERCNVAKGHRSLLGFIAGERFVPL